MSQLDIETNQVLQGFAIEVEPTHDVLPISHRADMIDNLTWPEGASPEVVAIVEHARAAHDLKQEVDSLFHQVQTSMTAHIRQHEGIADGHRQHLAERLSLLDGLTRAFERLGSTIDMTHFDIKVAQDYVQKAQVNVTNAEAQITVAEQHRDGIARELTDHSQHDQRIGTEIGKIIATARRDIHEQLARREHPDEDDASIERLVDARTAMPMSVQEKKVILHNLSPRSAQRHEQLLRERGPILQSVGAFQAKHREADTAVIARMKTRDALVTELEKEQAKHRELAQLQGPQQVRFAALQAVLTFLREETIRVKGHFDTTDEIEPLTATDLREIQSIIQDTSCDRAVADHKHAKEYTERAQKIRNRQLPNRAAAHVQPTIDALEQIRETTKTLAAVGAELQESSDLFSKGLRARRSEASHTIGQTSSDLHDALEQLVELAHLQDAIDLNRTATKNQIAAHTRTVQHRQQVHGEREEQSRQVLQDRSVLMEQLMQVKQHLDALTDRARVEHERQEDRRMHDVAHWDELSADQRTQLSEHDLIESDQLSGYNPHTAWTEPERRKFTTVEPGLIPPELLLEYTALSQMKPQFDERIEQLGQHNILLLNQMTSLMNECEMIQRQVQQEQANLATLTEQTTGNMEKLGEIRGLLILAKHRYEQARDTYAAFLHQVTTVHTAQVTPTEPAPVQPTPPSTATLVYDITGGSEPEITYVPPSDERPRADNLEQALVRSGEKTGLRRALGKISRLQITNS